MSLSIDLLTERYGPFPKGLKLRLGQLPNGRWYVSIADDWCGWSLGPSAPSRVAALLNTRTVLDAWEADGRPALTGYRPPWRRA